MGDDYMLFNIGDLVTRKSYNNDMVFNNIAILEGVNLRLVADANIEDLVMCNDCMTDLISDDDRISKDLENIINLNRDDYFYLPGKVLHIDADKGYLDRCIKFYKDMNINSYGVIIPEKDIHLKIKDHLDKINPDVLVITGHDAYYEDNSDEADGNYKNSVSFIKAVKEARKYERDQEKLIIVAGACQSDYEQLIKAGANFASSPKRINIHALDPAIIATSVCLSKKNQVIDLKGILSRTKYGKDGIGGILTTGVMYVGYPR